MKLYFGVTPRDSCTTLKKLPSKHTPIDENLQQEVQQENTTKLLKSANKRNDCGIHFKT